MKVIQGTILSRFKHFIQNLNHENTTFKPWMLYEDLISYSWSSLSCLVNVSSLSFQKTNFVFKFPLMKYTFWGCYFVLYLFPGGNPKLTFPGGFGALFHPIFVHHKVCWWILPLPKLCHASKKGRQPLVRGRENMEILWMLAVNHYIVSKLLLRKGKQRENYMELWILIEKDFLLM